MFPNRSGGRRIDEGGGVAAEVASGRGDGIVPAMARCEECGGRVLAPRREDGVEVLECELCGALQGDDAAVARALLAREARERGYDPAVYPLVRALARVGGLRVAAADAGDPEAPTWPFVQFAAIGPREGMIGLENLVKTLALAARELAAHWVVEAEFQARLLFTLKPRFHTDVDRIDARRVLAARDDLDRLRAAIERNMLLSWWRRP